MATPLSSHFPLSFFPSQSPSFGKPFLFSLRFLSYTNLTKLPRTSLLAFSSNNSGSSPFNDASGSNSSPSKSNLSFLQLELNWIRAVASEAISFREHFYMDKSVLTNLIQEIEPLDISLIQKDVPPSTVDAMKTTISDMLGLLPSDRFQVFIEALWEPLPKLLISSMMTCLGKTPDKSNFDLQEILLDRTKISDCSGKDNVSSEFEKTTEDKVEDIEFQSMGEISPETRKYILLLQSRLTSMKKELREIKGKNAALQMQQIAGEEKNDLLNYLRSLQPDKVAELSEPTYPELKETIHSVVHNLLTTLSPKMHSKTPPLSENTATGTLQPIISLTRVYLACLLFWCMLLGHYLEGLEYRMELIELLSSTSKAKDNGLGDEQVI
ncbi:hypothetical protein GOBAR_AA01416 [Gossypium barbadense]|uniref:MAR-binding filament-like protein 1 n=1 Tax=Gossypium barbadense TaxID=3634 RepID=A0A2P5YU42_GOSBA|nr:hypothetical protein GOBAR_AA01416 [Gossypium barbadense]